jgi:zinc protease
VGDAAVVAALYHIPAGAHPDYPPIDVLESILTAEPAGRLYKSLVETRKAAAVFGSAVALHDPGVLRIIAQATKGNEPQVVLETMLETLAKVRDRGVTQEEVERAKRRLLSDFERSITDSRRVAIQLSEWAAQGDWRLLFLYRDNIEKVSADSVNRVAARYLKANNRTVGMFIPTAKAQRITIPSTPNLAEIIGNYQGREAVVAGEAFDVTPANIEKQTKRITLTSGIEAALLEKKTRGEVVYLRLTLRYGNEENLKNLTKACEFLPQLMTRGTGRYNRQQLQDELDKYQARLRPSGSAGKMTFTIQVKRDNLLPVLNLFEDVLRQPTLPDGELQTLMQEEIAGLEQRLTDPQSLASVTVRRVLNQYPKADPRYVPTLTEEIEQIKAVRANTVKQLYDEYVGPSHGQLTIIGDFDAKQILPAVDRLLADWKPSRPYQRLKRLTSKVTPGLQTIDTPDKESAFYYAATAFPLRDDHPDYPSLVIGNFILGGGSLSSRLADRVRQKDGLSYGIGSGLQSLSIDHRTAFYIYASCKPVNMPKLRMAIRQEIDRLLKDGITATELKNAQQGYLQRQQVRRTRDDELAALLEQTMLTGRTMQFTADIEAKIGKLTERQIQTALKKHIDPQRLFIAEAGDFTKKPATKTGNKQPTTSRK